MLKKDRIFMAASVSLVVSAYCLFLLTPGEWWIGCSMWLIAGVWFRWAASLFGALTMGPAFVRLVCGVIREVRLSRRCEGDAVELHGVGCYVTRDVVCRASGKRQTQPFVRL